MASRRKKHNKEEKRAKRISPEGESFLSRFVLPEEARRWIFGLVIFIVALIVALSFFDLAGIAGRLIISGLTSEANLIL